MSLNQQFTSEYNGIGVFIVSCTVNTGQKSAAYLRDLTTGLYVAAFTGVDSNGGTHAIGFPLVKGHVYSPTFAGNTASERIQFYEVTLTN